MGIEWLMTPVAEGRGLAAHPVFWSVVFFTITFVLVEMAKVIEWSQRGVPFKRPRYLGAAAGDVVLFAAMLMSVDTLTRFEGSSLFYVQRWFYLALLLLGWLVSGLGVAGAIKENKGNPAKGFMRCQVTTLSKLVHDLAFGPAFAIALGLVVPALMCGSWSTRVGIGVAVAVYFGLNVRDNQADLRFRLAVLAHPHAKRDAQLSEAGITRPIY